MRDVRAGDAAGVERTQGQLRTRLADRLGGDDAHRVADRDELAGGHGHAVAALAHAGLGLALEHGANAGSRVVVLAERLGDLGQLSLVISVVLLDQDLAALPSGRRGEAAGEGRR